MSTPTTDGTQETIHTSKTARDEAPRVARRQERLGVDVKQKQYHRPRLPYDCVHLPPNASMQTIHTKRAPINEPPRATRSQERPGMQHKDTTTPTTFARRLFPSATGGVQSKMQTSKAPRGQTPRVARSQEHPFVQHEQKQYRRQLVPTDCPSRPPKDNAKSRRTNTTPTGEAPRAGTARHTRPYNAITINAAAHVYPTIAPTDHRIILQKQYKRSRHP